jgi:hypothetical protein
LKVLPGLLSPLADLSSVLPDMLSALRIMLSVFPNMSSVLPGVVRIVDSTPRCGKELRKFSLAHRGVFNRIPITPSALLYQWHWRSAGILSDGLFRCRKWLTLAYTPHTLWKSWRLPVTKIHFADEDQCRVYLQIRN